jgi:hypothetical protein
MRINWEINVGHLITLVMVVAAMIAGFVRFESAVGMHTKTLDVHQQKLQAQEAALQILDRDGTAYDRNSLVPRLQRIESDVTEIKGDVRRLVERR